MMKKFMKVAALTLALTLACTTAVPMGVGDNDIRAAASAKLTKTEVQAEKPTGVNASSYNYTKIKVTWDEIEGVDGYVVYRATSKDGKYSKAYTTSNPEKTYYINTNRTTGKTYWYKVRGYREIGSKTYYTKYSAVDSAYARPGQVKGLEVYGNDSSILDVTLSWKDVKGATDYEAQINRNQNGEWTGWKTYTFDEDGDKEYFYTYAKEMASLNKDYPDGYMTVVHRIDGEFVRKKITIEEAASLTKTQARIDIVEDESEYKFRVRAYHTENGKKVYGRWSETYTLKETLNVDEIYDVLRTYTIECSEKYEAIYGRPFIYQDDRTETPERGSYFIDGIFGSFSRYAKQEEVVESFKDNIDRYVEGCIKNNENQDPWGYLYIGKYAPGDRKGLSTNSTQETYYSIYMLY